MSTLQKEEPKEKWFDFKSVKEQSDVIAVLTHFNLLEKLELRPNEVVGWCPLGTKTHGKKDSFNFNIKKKTFKCFACKQHGSTLDFVAKYQQLHLREACEVLVMINEGTAPDAPLPQSNSEEVPVPTTELDSEASEQTIGQPERAEIEGNALRSPSADDPATLPSGRKKPEKYHYTLEEALYLVSKGKVSGDRLIVLDKVVLFRLMDEISGMIPEE